MHGANLADWALVLIVLPLTCILTPFVVGWLVYLYKQKSTGKRVLRRAIVGGVFGAIVGGVLGATVADWATGVGTKVSFFVWCSLYLLGTIVGSLIATKSTSAT